jgi:hypothetical protein
VPNADRIYDSYLPVMNSMKSASFVAVSLALLLSSKSASAANQSCSIQGVWQGRLGQTPITLEIDAEYGRYRYRDSLSDLLLQPRQGAENTWEEYDGSGKQTGSLKLACDSNAVSGTWTSPAGKSAPIAMQRARSYDGDRIKNAPLKVLEQKALSGHSIQIVSVQGLEGLQTLQIANPSPMEDKVNRILREELNEAVESHLNCVTLGYAAGRFADPYGDELGMEPVLWSGAILSVRKRYGGYCGGAHPYSDSSYLVFDTGKGTVVSIDRWISDDQMSLNGSKKISHASDLGQAIWSIAFPVEPGAEPLSELDRECRDALNEPAAAVASLEAKGIGFRYWYPYSLRKCTWDYVVPWKKLRPFLSPAGRQYVKQLQKR